MKRAVSLLRVVIAMVIAAVMLTTHVFAGAYSVAGPTAFVPPINTPGNPAGQNEFELFRIFHYVVRGDTLQSIANKWGTTPQTIIDFNQEYFNDLALRNITYNSSVTAEPVIRLEPGVRLHIYDVLRVRHYVRRGDTLAGLAAGNPNMLNATPSGMIIQTTVNAIQAENSEWFRDLARLNVTWGSNLSLTESGAIGSVYELRYFDWPFVLSSQLLNDPAAGIENSLGVAVEPFTGIPLVVPHNYRFNPWFLSGIAPFNNRWLSGNWNNPNALPPGSFFSTPITFGQWPVVTDNAGTPLFISVPARAWTFNQPTPATGTIPMPVYELSYYRSIAEQIPWGAGTANPAVFGHPQVTTFNPPTTNPNLDNIFVTTAGAPIAGFNLEFLGDQYVWFDAAPGIPVVGGTMTAPVSFAGLFGGLGGTGVLVGGGAAFNHGQPAIPDFTPPPPPSNQGPTAQMSPSPQDVPALVTPGAPGASVVAASGQTVTVERGDTLSGIASRHNTTWQILHELNRDTIGDNANVLRVGMELRLPA